MRISTSKKLFLPLFAAALCCPAGSFGQITTTSYSMDTAPLDGEETALYGTLRVSDNGKFAVGSDNESCHAAYLWDADTKQFTFLNEYTGSKSGGMIATDVADDGTVCGAFITEGEDADGNITRQYRPGYKPSGKDWVELPLPDNAYKKWFGTSYIDYAPTAERISPDGKLVLGLMQQTVTDAATGKATNPWLPVLWKIADDGTVSTTQYMDCGYEGGTFVPYDMSDDGSIIVGMAESVRGDQLPAMIKDGKFEFIAEPRLQLKEGYEDLYIEVDENGEPIEGGMYWTGIANFIDDDKNVYLYYSDGNETLHNVIYNAVTGEKRVLDISGIVSCGTDGWTLGINSIYGGSTTVLEGNKVDLSGLATVLSVSDDGTVVAGAGVGVAYGEQYNYPELLVLSGSPLTTGIQSVALEGVSLQREGNSLTVSGDYDRAELFNVAGQYLASGKGTFNLSGLDKGLYIMKVSKGGKSEVYKIMK